jgi:hypothetical protein
MHISQNGGQCFLSLIAHKPTASGRATVTGSAIPVSRCWETPERIAKNSGRGRYRERLLKSINLDFTNDKADPDTDSGTDPDVHRVKSRYRVSQSHGF